MTTDPLAEISGIKPKRYLKDGEQVEVQSKSSSVLRRVGIQGLTRRQNCSSSTYAVKRVDDHYYCKCPVSISLGNALIMLLTGTSRDGHSQGSPNPSTRGPAST